MLIDPSPLQEMVSQSLVNTISDILRTIWGFKPSVIKSLAIIYLMLLLVIQDGSFDINEKKKPFQRVKNTYMNPPVIPDTYTVILLFL